MMRMMRWLRRSGHEVVDCFCLACVAYLCWCCISVGGVVVWVFFYRLVFGRLRVFVWLFVCGWWVVGVGW